MILPANPDKTGSAESDFICPIMRPKLRKMLESATISTTEKTHA
jgi:hypothetical protein